MSSRNSLIGFIKPQDLRPRWVFRRFSVFFLVHRGKLSGLFYLISTRTQFCLLPAPCPSQSHWVGGLSHTPLSFLGLATLLLYISFFFFLLKILLNFGAEKGNLHFNCSLIDMPQQECGRPNNDPEKAIHILTPEPTNGTLYSKAVLWMWAKCNYQCSCKTETGRSEIIVRDVMTETRGRSYLCKGS